MIQNGIIIIHASCSWLIRSDNDRIKTYYIYLCSLSVLFISVIVVIGGHIFVRGSYYDYSNFTINGAIFLSFGDFTQLSVLIREHYAFSNIIYYSSFGRLGAFPTEITRNIKLNILSFLSFSISMLVNLILPTLQLLLFYPWSRNHKVQNV